MSPSASLPDVMDPTHNQASGQGQSTMSPTTPSSAYQMNPQRTKTKKWVTAKTQNYDGDDWGSPVEESDEESDSPDPTPQVPVAQGLPSETRAAVALPVEAPQPADVKSEPIAQPPPQATSQEVAPEAGEVGEKRASISPQLPNMARMSAFGMDLFDDGSKGAAAALDTQHTIQEEREPSPEPSSLVSHDAATRAVQSGSPPPQPGAQQALYLAPHLKHSEHDVSSVSEPEEVAARNISDSSTTEPHNISMNEPQLGSGLQISNTPATIPPEPKQDNAATSPDADTPVSIIPPTEPLQPKRFESSLPDYEPQPLRHTATLDTTASSPVKESDVLSDEIIRSLTPSSNTAGASKPGDSQASLVPGSQEKSAESSQVSVGEPGQATAVPIVSVPVQSHPAPQQSPVVPSTEETPRDLRRRFSWEAIGESEARPAQVPAQVPAPAQAPASVPVPPVSEPSVQPPADRPWAGQSPAISPSAGPYGSPISPTIKIVAEDDSIDRHVSAASLPQSTMDQSQPDVPSPSSEPSQLAKAQPDATSDITQSNASESEQRAVAGPSQGNDKSVMPFKEIMAISSPEERLEKYAESRSSFATTDSGLDEWISTMKARHPEHSNASGSFSGGLPPPGVAIARTPSPAGSQPSAQQPYYQQYLNASAPDRGPPASARSRLHGLQEHASAAAGSAFGNSGNQIGHKGKEFMQSAGKMGKGLFSKGKSKLRGTGDKVFH
jgi:serine/arginine repetitive matrix protein 2